MMRRVFSIALLAGVFVLAQSAWAGVTIDVQFQDQTSPTGITILPGDEGGGPGCTFTGYAGNSVASGRCMDVLIHTTTELFSIDAYVHYDNNNGLAPASFYEWRGVGVSFNMLGTPLVSSGSFDGLWDTGNNEIANFDTHVPPPSIPYPIPVGTYRLGTIVWNTAGTTPGTEAISITTIIVGAVINGTTYNISSEVVAGSHILTIVPEPGTASLLGLGLVGLILAGRRSRA